MEAKWPSAEFHRPPHRPGMQILCQSFPPFCKCASLSTTNFIFLQVSVIKVKIHEATGMPAGKQKLQFEVNFSFNLVEACYVSSQ